MNAIVSFKGDLDRLNTAGELALPDTVPFKAFKNAAIIAVTDNPQILNCDKQSVFKAIRTIAAAGLVPDGREAAIVPFKGKAQAMTMVYGLIKTARNSGKVSHLWGDVIYEGETIEVWIEDGERKWQHVNNDGSRINVMKRGGAIEGAYAVVKLTDGTVDFQPMTREEIEKRRMISATQKDPHNPTGIWEKWYPEMCIKTVIRNLSKRLPMSSDDVSRMMVEQDVDMRDITPDAPERSAFAEKIAAARAEAEPQEPEEPQDPTPKDETPTVEDAEIIPDEEPAPETPEPEPKSEPAEHWTVSVDTDGSFPGSSAFDEGAKARQAGMKRTMCPYTNDQGQAADWLGGFDEQGKEE